MNEITSALVALLPPCKKTSATGWKSYNAMCCEHRGESRDTRHRLGALFNDAGFVLSCYNCKFKAKYVVGGTLSANCRLIFRWLGASDIDISKLGLIALRQRSDLTGEFTSLSFELSERTLPNTCQKIDEWLVQGCEDPKLFEVIDYLVNERGMEWDWYSWYWDSSPGHSNRVLIPYYHYGKLVGWTERKISPGNPKYLNNSQPSIVFNLDNQTYDRNFVVVVEGQFDAIAVDGVAVLTNSINQAQVARINALGREVIVVPDRDSPGAEMIKHAISNGWSVSMPPWSAEVKDVADAAKRYGRLYTLYSILYYKITNPLKIKLLLKQLENTIYE